MLQSRPTPMSYVSASEQHPRNKPNMAVALPVAASPAKTATAAPTALTDVKPRLTKDQHDILEAHFQKQHKPSTATKRGIAADLGVTVDKINNWFQNRRAKVKQEHKKAQQILIQQQQLNMAHPYHPMGTQPIPMVTSSFSPDQQLRRAIYQADVSPTSRPVQSIEIPSAPDLGLDPNTFSKLPEMHGLGSIPEADRTTYFDQDAIMRSIMAASEGPSYMHHTRAANAHQSSGGSYNYQTQPAYVIPNVLPSEDSPPNSHYINDNFYSLNPSHNPNPSSTEVQTTPGTLAAELSRSQSTVNTQSPRANPSSLASVYSNYTDDTKPQHGFFPVEDGIPFHIPDNAPEPVVFEQYAPWGSQPFPRSDGYQDDNVSAQALMSSSEQPDDQNNPTGIDVDTHSAYSGDVYSRRNSSTTNLASNIEAINIQNTQNRHTPDSFKQPKQPASIADRRRKRPTALNSTTLKSASHTGSMPSPAGNNEHPLRRIRSSGIQNGPGRIQKPSISAAAQRSPNYQTFAESATSPKFARTFSTGDSATIRQGASLAPPTPSTPNGVNMRNMYNGQDNCLAMFPMDRQPHRDFSNAASPPSTPLDRQQWTNIASDSIYRDTPPQSAPATQQSFPTAPQMKPPYHSTTDLTLARPKTEHSRRPSLPSNDLIPGYQSQSLVLVPNSFQNSYSMDVVPLSTSIPYGRQYSGFQHSEQYNVSNGLPRHNVPFAPYYIPQPPFNQYAPSQDTGHGNPLRRTEPQPKSYIFANQGPGDFRSG